MVLSGERRPAYGASREVTHRGMNIQQCICLNIFCSMINLLNKPDLTPDENDYIDISEAAIAATTCLVSKLKDNNML